MGFDCWTIAMEPEHRDEAPKAHPGNQARELVNENLYCLTCGYNLRGLYGDPVRCPECGVPNDLSEVRIPAQRIKYALQGMETMPTACTALTLAIFVCFVFIAHPTWRTGTLVPSLLLIIFALAWIGCYLRMKRQYSLHRGWRTIILSHHAALALFLLVPTYSLGVLTDVGGAFWDSKWEFPVYFVLWFLFTAIALSLHGRTERKIASMRRDAAVEIARGELRQERHWRSSR